MKITYTLTDEDLNKFSTSNFSNKNKTIPKVLFFAASLVLIVILIMALIAQDYIFALMPAIFLLIAYFILKSPKILRNKYLKSIDTTGVRAVEINNSELIATNSSRSTSYRLNTVDKVELLDDYFVFIKFNQGDSLIIPSSAFSTKDEMINFINKIKTNAKIL